MMPTNKSRQPPRAASVMTDDHSEIDQLIHELLGALDKKDRAQSFEHLDLLWARLAVHIRAEHLSNNFQSCRAHLVALAEICQVRLPGQKFDVLSHTVFSISLIAQHQVLL